MMMFLGILVLLVMLVFGMPVAFALGIAGMAGLFTIGGLPMVEGVLRTVALSTTSSYELLTIPMFILMAEFIIVSRIADELFDCAATWIGRTPAGLAISTAIAGAGFGAISGSSTASAATLSATTIPAMLRNNYNPRFAAGVVAISGPLAMLIPPSIALILYGLIADISVSKLLIAGIVPGVLVTCVIILTSLLLVFLFPNFAPAGRAYTMAEKFRSLKIVGPMVVLISLVTGCIYLGIATPTESASLGAFGAMCIALARKRLSVESFYMAMRKAAATSCMIVMIIICAHIFSYYFTLTGVTQNLVALVAGLKVDSWMILTLIIMLYLVLGCFMDQIAILFLTVPITLPIILALGYDPFWFGVVVIITAEIGLVTPPIGLNVFVVSAYSDVKVKDIFIGVSPHVVAHLFIIALLAIFPAIVTWLPESVR
ncbi:MAG: TRAP transporter large permease [Alphaproteobacteria bacterium]|nr:MAG: TRAP transporter large permease [Alphaproteobacteria bacterium]